VFVLPILVNEKDVYTLFYRFKTTISEILSNYATLPRPRVRTAAPSLVDRLSTNTRHDTTRPRRDRRTTTSRPPARRTSDRPATAAAAAAAAAQLARSQMSPRPSRTRCERRLPPGPPTIAIAPTSGRHSHIAAGRVSDTLSVRLVW